MFRLKGKKKIQAVVLVLLITAIAYASASGPEARYTGAPGDINSCVQCHDTYHEANVGPGSVRITNNPAVYEPGQPYTVTVTVQQSARQKYGFQLTAIDSNGNKAGQLTPINSDTQVNSQTGTGGREYIQHSQSGTLPNGQGSRTWQVRWTAPSTDIGTVRFFVAGNAANGNGANDSDYIYTNTALSESPTTVVTLTLETQPTGQTLVAGSKYLIDWTVTNPSNVDSYELRYSTDDGMTFPITNLITPNSITDPAVTSYEWTVPNVSSTQARLRVLAATKSGTAIEVKSDKFTITGDGSVQIPRITNAEVIGKHLYVDGVNLKTDGKVEMDGVTQKTSYESATRLKCKKAGKKIAKGQEVDLVIKFPDGSRTDVFVWVRPSQ
jgi:hypothetical protein